MLKPAYSLFLCIFFASFSSHAADAIGFREVALPAAGKSRSVNVAVWYPTSQDRPSTLLGDNPAFVGLSIVQDAPVKAGRYPLVVISHGYGGNWTNQAWLAGELVRNGYIVAAPNHPGTTTRDKRPAEAAKLWERPRDISRVIDALTVGPVWSAVVASDRIAVIGHSLGGWTAMEVAGGRFDAGRFEADCAAHAGLASCGVYKEIGTGLDTASRMELAKSRKDTRVGAVVVLDLGLARGFDSASLAVVDVPVLIVAAGAPNPELPADLESHYLSEQLPAATTSYMQIDDAAHFTFLPVCKPGAAVLLEEDMPGDGVICLDGGGRERAILHQLVRARIMSFLAAVWERS